MSKYGLRQERVSDGRLSEVRQSWDWRQTSVQSANLLTARVWRLGRPALPARFSWFHWSMNCTLLRYTPRRKAYSRLEAWLRPCLMANASYTACWTGFSSPANHSTVTSMSAANCSASQALFEFSTLLPRETTNASVCHGWR